jgi:hypothetical protein
MRPNDLAYETLGYVRYVQDCPTALAPRMLQLMRWWLGIPIHLSERKLGATYDTGRLRLAMSASIDVTFVLESGYVSVT